MNAQPKQASRLIAPPRFRVYKVAGRVQKSGQEAHERAVRNKAERRRFRRNGARGFSCADHRTRHPHVPVPAVQYPIRLDDGDAADRRLSVRVEIFLRLHPFFAAVLAAVFLRPHLRLRSPTAATSSCSACRRTTSTDYIKRVIGLPGDKIQMIDGVLNINGTPVKRERIDDFVTDEDGGGRKRIKRWRETLPEGVSYTTLDLRRQRLLRQHAGLHRAARPLLHDGRQSRQFDRQPRAQRRSATCRSRTSSGAPSSSSSRSAKASTPGRFGAGPGRCVGAGCSRWCDERARKSAARFNIKRASAPSMGSR